MVTDFAYSDTSGVLVQVCEPNITDKDIRIEFQARKSYTVQLQPRKQASGRLRMRSLRKFSTI